MLTGRRPRAALVHGAAGWRLGAAPARAGLQAGGLSCVLSVAPALQMPVLSRLYSPYRRARLRSAVLQLGPKARAAHIDLKPADCSRLGAASAWACLQPALAELARSNAKKTGAAPAIAGACQAGLRVPNGSRH